VHAASDALDELSLESPQHEVIELLSSDEEMGSEDDDGNEGVLWAEDAWGDDAVMTWDGEPDMDNDSVNDGNCEGPNDDDWGADACLEWNGPGEPQDSSDAEVVASNVQSEASMEGEWHDMDTVSDDSGNAPVTTKTAAPGASSSSKSMPDYASWDTAKLNVSSDFNSSV
jgi:hypothetical protein